LSRIAWACHLAPGPQVAVEDLRCDLYDPPLAVARTRSLPQPTRDLAALPDPRVYRSLSRAGVMLCAVGLQARTALAPHLARDRYRVGLYGVADAGPQSYEAARLTARAPREEFAALYRRLNHPKRYLATLVNLPATQLGIFLDLRGPVNVYCHSTAAARHALDQVEIDLAEGIVEAALLVAAFSLEDPLLALRSRCHGPPEAVLAEGAAALLLVPEGGAPGEAGPAPAGEGRPAPPATDWYALAHPIVDLAMKESPSC
jgi:hypothetical protein